MADERSRTISEAPIRPEHRCMRCRRRWLGRSPYRPVHCPRCKSATWDRPAGVIAPRRGAA